MSGYNLSTGDFINNRNDTQSIDGTSIMNM